MADFNFDPQNNAVKGIRTTLLIEDLSQPDAMKAYFKRRVEELSDTTETLGKETKQPFRTTGHPWIKKHNKLGYLVDVNLDDMQFYWSYDAATNDGNPYYKVGSFAEGKAFLQGVSDNIDTNEELSRRFEVSAEGWVRHNEKKAEIQPLAWKMAAEDLANTEHELDVDITVPTEARKMGTALKFSADVQKKRQLYIQKAKRALGYGSTNYEAEKVRRGA